MDEKPDGWRGMEYSIAMMTTMLSSGPMTVEFVMDFRDRFMASALDGWTPKYIAEMLCVFDRAIAAQEALPRSTVPGNLTIQ